MAFLVGQRLDYGDRRWTANTTTLTADGAFEGGYYDVINTASGAQRAVGTRANAAVTLTNAGDFIIMRGHLRISSSATWNQNCAVLGFISGTSNTTFDNGEVWLRVSAAQELNLLIKDANGNSTTGTAADLGSTALTDDTVYLIEMKYEKLSSTQLKVWVRVDGADVGSTTHTAAGGVGSPQINGGHAVCSGSAKLTGIYHFNGVQLCDSSGSAPNDWFSDLDTFKGELILPNGDVVGETGWTASGGGTGARTEWDDAVASFSTADYNESGTGAGAETQASDFAATSGTLDAGDTVCGVTVMGAASTTSPWGAVLIVSDDGTEDAQTSVAFEAAAAGGYTFTSGGSGAWTKSSVDSANFKIRTAADATNRRVEAFWAFVWSFTPAAGGGTTRVFAWIQ